MTDTSLDCLTKSTKSEYLSLGDRRNGYIRKQKQALNYTRKQDSAVQKQHCHTGEKDKENGLSFRPAQSRAWQRRLPKKYQKCLQGNLFSRKRLEEFKRATDSSQNKTCGSQLFTISTTQGQRATEKFSVVSRDGSVRQMMDDSHQKSAFLHIMRYEKIHTLASW